MPKPEHDQPPRSPRVYIERGGLRSHPSDFSAEQAREVFVRYFSQTVTEWRQHGGKGFRHILKEVIRMKRAYPEVYAEFLQGLDAEAEEERRFREFMEKHERTSTRAE